MSGPYTQPLVYFFGQAKVGEPEHAGHDEADDVIVDVREEREEIVHDPTRIAAHAILELEVEDQQRHRDGEDAVGKGFDPGFG